MRLTVTSFLTLDGVHQAPGGPDEDRSGGFDLGGWLPPHFDDAVGGYMTEIFKEADAFLLGRRTYDIFAGYWPNAEEPGDEVGLALNRLPKHVATGHPDDLAPWNGAQALDGDLGKAVTELKDQPGRELQVHGSATLVQSLMREGLVDTYRLLVFPVVLGRGRRLFADGVPPTGLRLTDSRTSGSGVLMATYDAAGAPEFGSVDG
ncbi:dihydrofolate reductase family protein [Micromonospora endolithica]|uniref:Dihydrofolate reductase n=1 Tax=Micromonospora endolithica TaxID=230091 RepID=A0A3A9ZTT1_9ACTN|nr:dihydrofolate reductase family protein [Micromonospora endolithica]RKN50976.1 dihydrofolate reductase [Micromonospora endolithica]TWJ20242.1 RibD domain-containing protein [Micromonospora endolithica]